MMSNLYPVSYVGALTDHFGDPLSPGENYPPADWHNFARLAHCGYVGVVSPEMTPSGKTYLRSWGETYEIKRDGRGCGVDGDLAKGEPITVISLRSDMQHLMIAQGRAPKPHATRARPTARPAPCSNSATWQASKKLHRVTTLWLSTATTSVTLRS